MHPGNWQHSSHVGAHSTLKTFIGSSFQQHLPTDVVPDRAYNENRTSYPQSLYPHVSSGGHQIGQMQMFSGYPTQSQGPYMFHHHLQQEQQNMSQHSASQQSISQNISHASVQNDDRQLESAASKKKHFEEQQRKLKLMSSKQKQPTGHRTVDELMKSTDLNLTGAVQSGFSKGGRSQVLSSATDKEPLDPLRNTSFLQSYSAMHRHGGPNQSALLPHGSNDFGTFEGFPSMGIVSTSKPAITSTLPSHATGGPASTSANQLNTAFSANRPVVGNILRFPAENLSSVPNEKGHVGEISSLGLAQHELPRHNNSSAAQPFSVMEDRSTSSEFIAEFGDFSVAKTVFPSNPNFVSNVNSESSRDKAAEFGDFCALPASDGTSILDSFNYGESTRSGVKSGAESFSSYGTADLAFTSDRSLLSFGGTNRDDPALGLHTSLQNTMQMAMVPDSDFGHFSTNDNEERAASQAYSGQSKTHDPLLSMGSDREDEDALSPEKLYGSPLPQWCLSPGSLPAVFHNVLTVCRSFDGSIDTSKLQPILLSSKLTKEQLGYIWDSANKKIPGIIDEIELYLILGLVALAQAGWTKLSIGKLASCRTAPIPEFPEHILTQQESFVSEAAAYAGVDDGPIDPNDKYSAFRMIKRDDGESASNADQRMGLTNDNNWADWAALPASTVHTKGTSTVPAEDDSGWAFFKSSEVDQAHTAFIGSEMAKGLSEFAAFESFDRHSEATQQENLELGNSNSSTIVATGDFKLEGSGGRSSKLSRELNTSSSTAYRQEPSKTNPIFLLPDIKDSPVLAEQPRSKRFHPEVPSSTSHSFPYSKDVEIFSDIQACASGLKQPSSKNVVQDKPADGVLPVNSNSGALSSSGLPSLKRSTSYGEVKLTTELNALYLGYDSLKPSVVSYSGGLGSTSPSDIDVAEAEFGSFTQFDTTTHAGEHLEGFGNFGVIAPPVPKSGNPEGGVFTSDAMSFNWESQTAGKRETHSSSNFSDGFFPDKILACSDRYQALTGEMQDGERHVEDWKRCLQSVINVLERGVLLIRQHSLSISARREVVQDPKGKEYFDGLKEIYAVAARLKVSVQNSALARGNTDLVLLMNKVDNLWNELKNFLAGVSEIGHLNGLDMSSLLMGEEADLAKSCGICLLNTDTALPPSPLVEWMLNSSFFMYGGKVYHATCANFWCNKVSSVLPALQPLTSGLL